MTHITLSIPKEIYLLMKKYNEINWSEVARRAIIEKILSLKAMREGLTRIEFNMLLKVMNKEIAVERFNYRREKEFLEAIKEREGLRRRLLNDLERR